MNILDYYITESDAATMLGVERNTIARWAKGDALTCYRCNICNFGFTIVKSAEEGI